jgi:hypothetical protein
MLLCVRLNIHICIHFLKEQAILRLRWLDLDHTPSTLLRLPQSSEKSPFVVNSISTRLPKTETAQTIVQKAKTMRSPQTMDQTLEYTPRVLGFRTQLLVKFVRNGMCQSDYTSACQECLAGSLQSDQLNSAFSNKPTCCQSLGRVRVDLGMRAYFWDGVPKGAAPFEPGNHLYQHYWDICISDDIVMLFSSLPISYLDGKLRQCTKRRTSLSAVFLQRWYCGTAPGPWWALAMPSQLHWISIAASLAMWHDNVPSFGVRFILSVSFFPSLCVRVVLKSLVTSSSSQNVS